MNALSVFCQCATGVPLALISFQIVFHSALGHSIGLGFIKRGSERMGDVVRAVDFMRGGGDIEVEIVSPHMIDPEGERLRA